MSPATRQKDTAAKTKGAPIITDAELKDARRRADEAEQWLEANPQAWRTFEGLALLLTEHGQWVRLSRVGKRVAREGITIPTAHLPWLLARFASEHPDAAKFINPKDRTMLYLASGR